jgi:hypothetical protein
MASEFEKKYGESLAVFQHTNVFKIAEFDALIQKEREVTRAEGEQFVLQDRKNGFYYFAAEDGTFTLPKKNDYVIFLSTLSDMCWQGPMIFLFLASRAFWVFIGFALCAMICVVEWECFAYLFLSWHHKEKEADIAKLRTEQAAKEKETAERQKKVRHSNRFIP